MITPDRWRTVMVWGLPIVVGLTMVAYALQASGSRFEALLVAMCGLPITSVMVFGGMFAIQ